MPRSRTLLWSDVSSFGVTILKGQPLDRILSSTDDAGVIETANILHGYITKMPDKLVPEPSRLFNWLGSFRNALYMLRPRRTPMLSVHQNHVLFPEELEDSESTPDYDPKKECLALYSMLSSIHSVLQFCNEALPIRAIPNLLVQSRDYGRSIWNLQSTRISSPKHGRIELYTQKTGHRPRTVKAIAFLHCTNRGITAPEENIAQEISSFIGGMCDKDVVPTYSDLPEEVIVRITGVTLHSEYLRFSVLELPVVYLRRGNSTSWVPKETDRRAVKFFMSTEFNILEDDGLHEALKGLVALLSADKHRLG